MNSLSVKSRIGVGYVRTSSTSNPKESIPNQKELIIAYCAQQGLILQEIIQDEAQTGMLVENRQGYQRLKQLVDKRAVGFVVVAFFSRIARTCEELISIIYETKTNGVEFISINENLMGTQLRPVYTAAIGFTVEYDNEMRRKACEYGKKSALEQGKFAFSTLPYGYRRDERNHLVIHEEEASHVRTIFALALEGKRLCEIAKSFANSKITKSYGPSWDGQHISKILDNQTYTGIIYHQKYKVKEPYSKKKIRSNPVPASKCGHPPIISEKVFEQVQVIVKIARSKKQKKILHEHLLSRVLYCSNCGSLMYADHRRRRYECKNKRNGVSSCKDLQKDEIERKVLDWLLKLENDQMDLSGEVIYPLQNETDLLIAKRYDLNRKFMKHMITLERYDNELKAITRELENVDNTTDISGSCLPTTSFYKLMIQEGNYKSISEELRKDKFEFTLNEQGEVIQLHKRNLNLID